MTTRRIAWLLLVLAVLPAAAPASNPTRATLSDLIEDAELIAVGRVVAREGDPRTFGFVRHAFEIQQVWKGDAPADPPLLQGNYKETFDPETGERTGAAMRSDSVSWPEGAEMLAFLHRIDGAEVWGVHPLGRRRLAPADYALYATKVAELLELLQRPDDGDRVDAMRAWALSLLDHSATLHDAAYELVAGDGSPREPPRLGEYSDDDRRRILQALLAHGDRSGWDHGYVVRTLIALVEDVPSELLDVVLASYVSHPWEPYPGQRARYATLLAERLDDDGLRELAASLERLVRSADSRSDDPAKRGAWMIEVIDRGWEFHDAAHASIQRFHR